MIFQSIKNKAFSLLAAMGALCAGCHSAPPFGGGEPDVPITEPDKVTLCLNVSFDGQGSQTRAENDPDDYEDPSGDFEKVRTLRVIIVRDYKEEEAENGSVLQTGIVEDNRMVATNDLGRPLYDNLEFKVIANEYKRIYLIANEQYLTAPAAALTAPQTYDTASKYLDSFKGGEAGEKVGHVDLSSLSNWTVSVPDLTSTMTQIVGYGNGLFSPAPSRRLPLTEFFDIKVDEKTNDDKCYSNLFITRAAAKATFFLDPAGLDPYKEHDIKITSISLAGVGSEEYVFPNETEYSLGKYKEDGKPNSNVRETYITTFATPEASKPLTYLLNFPDGISMDITGSEAVPIAGPIYFPESILAKDQYYEVTVTLSSGVELKAPLKTKGENIANILNINGREAIARNTHLQINLKIEDQELTAEVTIVPYIGIDLTPSFGFEQLLPGDHHQPTDW